MDKGYLPAHIATFGLMVVGIFAVRRVIMPPLYLWWVLLTVAFSFSVSWFWRNKKPPFLKTLVNILVLGVVIKAFCVIPEFKLNFSVEFIKSLVLVQLFHSFVISSKRDYALNQLIATMLIIFSAVFGLGDGDYYLIHLMIFLLLFIFILRFSVFYERRKKCIASVAFSKRDYGITNQLKLSVIFLLILIIVSVLLYPLIPRLDISPKLIPLSFIGRPGLWDMPERADLFWYNRDEKRKVTEGIGRLKREYSMRKEDFPGGGIIWSQKKRSPLPGESEDLIPGPGTEGRDLKQDVTVKEKRYQEILKEYQRLLEDEQRQLAQRRFELKEELRGLKGEIRSHYQRLIEELSEAERIASEEMEEGQFGLQYLAQVEKQGKVDIIEEEIKPEKARVAFRWVIFLVTLLSVTILLSIVLFYFLKKLREKYRLKKLALENPKLFIINLYDIACKIFAIYGCICTEFMEAKEYLTMVSKKLAALTDDFKTVTDLFLEARYSTHPILVRHSALISDAYGAIIEEVKQYGKLWQRLLTRFKSINIQISSGW